jgi:hypothetical protein
MRRMWPPLTPKKLSNLAAFLGLALSCSSLALCCHALPAQQPVSGSAFHTDTDTDHDGLSDALEQQLLVQFMPRFMMAEHDCSVRPAEFKAGVQIPEVQAENGTIYGQAFPAKEAKDHSTAAELHYYHLWRKDCGGHGHALDTEHVAVLIQASDTDVDSAKWKAVYWYAAAHENTVCDVSQIARASTLHAEDRGATVWISPGKHASYLNGSLCQTGCGADRCEKMTELVPAKLINLGEPGLPMNDSVFISSKAWPLEYKMSNSNFPAAALVRLNQLPNDDIAWFNPGKHPVQGVIAKSSSTEHALAISGGNTTAAISVAGSSTGNALSDAGDSTGTALSTASGNTGNALEKSYKHTRHALGTSMRHVGEALHLTPKPDDAQPQ